MRRRRYISGIPFECALLHPVREEAQLLRSKAALSIEVTVTWLRQPAASVFLVPPPLSASIVGSASTLPAPPAPALPPEKFGRADSAVPSSASLRWRSYREPQ